METHIFYCLKMGLNNAVAIAVDLFKSKQESSEYRKPIAIQYLIRQNDEQYVDNLISSDTEDSILEYLTEQLNTDNHHLIDELIRRNSESRDGLLFLRNLIILNRREGMIKYVEYVETHLCIPEQEDSSADITMQIRKIENVSLSDLIVRLLELAYNPCFNDNLELGLKAALDSLLYRMCQKYPNEMLSYLQTLDLNNKNEMLKTKYNYYITIINNGLKAVSDSPWTFDQAVEYIKTNRNYK